MGRAGHYTYESRGLTDVATDAAGHQTKFFYRNAADSLRGMVDSISELHVETWQEPVGTPLDDTTDVFTDQTMRFAYDARGSLRTVTSPTGVTTTYVADSIGRVTNVYDALATRTRRFYDSRNRVDSIYAYTRPGVIPYGVSLGYPFACDTSQTTCVDATAAVFNPALPDTMPDVARTVFHHAAAGVDSIADPRGVTRTYRYDGHGDLKIEQGEISTSRWWRNAAGAVDSTFAPLGSTKVIRSYDPRGLVASITYPSQAWIGGWEGYPSYGSYTDPGDVISYTFDALGSVLTANNRTGTISRTYYADGSLKSKTTSLNGGGNVDVLAYTYDSSGAALQVVHGLDRVDYGYGGDGRLQSLTVTLGAPANTVRQFQFAWDGLGRRRQVDYPSDPAGPAMRVSYRYDAAGIRRRVVSDHPDAPLRPSGPDVFDFAVRVRAVDPAGRILTEEMQCSAAFAFTGNPCGASGAASTGNQFNRLGFLVLQTGTSGLDSMQYDLSGNMTYRHGGAGTEVRQFSTRWHDNSLQFSQTSAPSSPAPLQYDYTSQGARRHAFQTYEDGSWRQQYFFYDGLGRMTGEAGWSEPAVWTDRFDTCRYDPDGQMARACDLDAPFLAFDGPNHVKAFVGSGSWTFVHGPGLDDPLMGYYRPNAGGSPRILYWVTDANGRQLAVADSSGVHRESDDAADIGTWRYAGTTSAPNTFNSNRMGSNGVPGLSFFRNRVYDAQTGRWLQEDPIGVAGGLNLYQFNGNNPVTFSDPFGLDPYINCRPVGGEGNGGKFAHCAIRVKDEQLKTDVVIELVPNNKGKKQVFWLASGSTQAQAYDANTWVKVSTPAGMTTEAFDKAVLNSAYTQTKNQVGRQYWPGGGVNSNHFVYSTITGAGGTMPSPPIAGFSLGAPGLCGGSGLKTGTSCQN
jgi:RHS repeat-associated protein